MLYQLTLIHDHFLRCSFVDCELIFIKHLLVVMSFQSVFVFAFASQYRGIPTLRQIPMLISQLVNSKPGRYCVFKHQSHIRLDLRLLNLSRNTFLKPLSIQKPCLDWRFPFELSCCRLILSSSFYPILPFAEVGAIQGLGFMWEPSTSFLPGTVLVFTCCPVVIFDKNSSDSQICPSLDDIYIIF